MSKETANSKELEPVSKDLVPGGAGADQTPAPIKRWNDDIDLSAFKYQDKMTGDKFKAYNDLVIGKFEENDRGTLDFIGGGLNAEKTHDFSVYRVRPVRKLIYPKSKDTSTELNGFIFENEKPSRVTAMPLKHANLLNAQLDSSAGGTMDYYLLTKY